LSRLKVRTGPSGLVEMVVKRIFSSLCSATLEPREIVRTSVEYPPGLAYTIPSPLDE
jgi:hypothetical protein